MKSKLHLRLPKEQLLFFIIFLYCNSYRVEVVAELAIFHLDGDCNNAKYTAHCCSKLNYHGEVQIYNRV